MPHAIRVKVVHGQSFLWDYKWLSLASVVFYEKEEELE